MAVREFVLSAMALGGVCALGALAPSTPPLLTYPIAQNVDSASVETPEAAAPVAPAAAAVEAKAPAAAPVVKAQYRTPPQRETMAETVAANDLPAVEPAPVEAKVELASAPANEPVFAEIAEAGAPPA